MGLDYQHHVLVGIDISGKRKLVRDDEDTFLPYIEGHYGIDFRIVDDYESRKFLYFGKELADGDQYEGIEKTEIDISSLHEIKQQVREKYEELFQEPCDESKVKLIACTVIW